MIKKFTVYTPDKSFGGVTMERGWGNGYVAIPPDHKYHGKHYDDLDIEVHGGLTFTGNAHLFPDQDLPDSYWVIGFDTAHYGDTKETWPKERLEAEVEKLYLQLINPIKP